MINAQQWLNENINKRIRGNIHEIHILATDDLENNPEQQAVSSSRNKHFYLPVEELEGELDLSAFPRLKKIDYPKAINY